MNPTVKLTGNLVLLMPVPQKKMSKGGVALPQDARYEGDTQEYFILAAGPGVLIRKKGKPDRFVENPLKRGDYVIAPLYLGHKLKMPNGTTIVEADQIIAKVDREPN